MRHQVAIVPAHQSTGAIRPSPLQVVRVVRLRRDVKSGAFWASQRKACTLGCVPGMSREPNERGASKSWIQPGVEYAYREKRVPRAKLERVRVLERVRKTKWKAEWIEPNAGLVHYVESRQLVSTWKDHKSFLKQEEQELSIREDSARAGYRKDSPVDRALYEVFDSIGDDLSYYNGILSCEPEALARFKARIAADAHHQSPHGYVGSDGKLHLPFGDAVALARAFCAAEPSMVLVRIEATERKWAQSACRPGEEYIVDLLSDYRAAWALIRQWAGHDSALAIRDAEIERLERLVWDAVYVLQKAGLDREAVRFRRAITKE